MPDFTIVDGRVAQMVRAGKNTRLIVALYGANKKHKPQDAVEAGYFADHEGEE